MNRKTAKNRKEPFLSSVFEFISFKMEKQTKKDKKVPMKNKSGPATPTIVKDKVLDFVKFVID